MDCISSTDDAKVSANGTWGGSGGIRSTQHLTRSLNNILPFPDLYNSYNYNL